VAVASAACPTPGLPIPLIKLGGAIEQRWRELKCDEGPGNPISPERRHLWSGGIFQDFERGQIVVHPRWAGDPNAKMTGFVLSAHVKDANTIHVTWGDTSPFNYESFNVRWDLDNHQKSIEEQHEPVGGFLEIGSEDPQQIEVDGSKTKGETDIDAKGGGTYIISIEGCNSAGWFGLGTECKQGWSFPVEVDHKLVTLSKSTAVPVPPPIVPPGPPFDPMDGPALEAKQRNELLKAVCHDPADMIDTEGGHQGELKTDKAIAVLQVLRDSPPLLGPPVVDCFDPGSNKALSYEELRKSVNAKIKRSTVVSNPGTDDGTLKSAVGAAIGVPVGSFAGGVLGWLLAGPGGSAIGAALGAVLGAAAGAFIGGEEFDPGDYDMRLVGLIRIAYWYPDLLDESVKNHLIHKLLTMHGGADERREYVYVGGIPTPIPESENHILMTESSRYLTNQLLAAEYKKDNKAVPQENNNDLNGMNDWMLEHLQSFLQNDFYEYNARPYTFQAMEGISNLFEFAARGDSCWRSNPPDPAQALIPRACHVRRGTRMLMDYHAARFATASSALRRVSPNRRQPEQRHYSRLFGRQSDSMTWRYVTLTEEGALFRDHRYGRLPAGAGDLLTPALGAYRMPRMIANIMSGYTPPYFQRFAFMPDGHPAVELYYREPTFLISAGGFHDDGRAGLFEGILDIEDAWARPTTLMPRAAGLDYNHFIRIDGAPDDDDRVNTCIAPGFACGLNPVIPSGIPEACLLRNGNWTVVDMNSTTLGCDLNYGFYVVVYKQTCVPTDCQKEAGDGGSFGFFEVTHAHSLEGLLQSVTAANQGKTFRPNKINVYSGTGGRTYTFQPMTSGGYDWGMISVAQGSNVANFERDISKWPLVQGELMQSSGHNGCVQIDNPTMNLRLILDYSDANNPKRTRVSLLHGGARCGCPLVDECLPPRYE
jgi:hypothetical protein